jgi:hypothetical protein
MANACIAPSFLTPTIHGNKCRRHALTPLPRENRPWYPFHRRMGWLQNRSWRCGIEKLSSLCREWNPRPSSLSLYRLSCGGSHIVLRTTAICMILWHAVLTADEARQIVYFAGWSGATCCRCRFTVPHIGLFCYVMLCLLREARCVIS